MTLPKEVWQDDPLEADNQDPAAEISPQVTLRGTAEEPDTNQRTEASSCNPISFTI